jgi:hypothetical protein
VFYVREDIMRRAVSVRARLSLSLTHHPHAPLAPLPTCLPSTLPTPVSPLGAATTRRDE